MVTVGGHGKQEKKKSEEEKKASKRTQEERKKERKDERRAEMEKHLPLAPVTGSINKEQNPESNQSTECTQFHSIYFLQSTYICPT